MLMVTSLRHTTDTRYIYTLNIAVVLHGVAAVTVNKKH